MASPIYKFSTNSVCLWCTLCTVYSVQGRTHARQGFEIPVQSYARSKGWKKGWTIFFFENTKFTFFFINPSTALRADEGLMKKNNGEKKDFFHKGVDPSTATRSKDNGKN